MPTYAGNQPTFDVTSVFLHCSLKKMFFDFFQSVHLILWPQIQEILGVGWEVKIGVAERIEGRDRVRLKGNDETESLRPPELAANRKKNTKNTITTDAGDNFLQLLYRILKQF